MPPLASALRNGLAAALSRFFPKTLDVTLEIDASQEGDYLYLDLKLIHADSQLRLNDLRAVPHRIKIGSRHFKISAKNRHTLAKLAEWDPIFDPRRGFVFYEKDVPEILVYLRSKATPKFSQAAEGIRVDTRPLEFVHNVEETETEALEIKSSLIDHDSTIAIQSQEDVKFLDSSRFAHSSEGYFRKPEETKYHTFREAVGSTTLRQDQIPLFLIYDLKRLGGNKQSRISPTVVAQQVFSDKFEPKVSLHVDGPWIWLDVHYEADRFAVPFSEMREIPKDRQFTRKEDTWLKLDRETHNGIVSKLESIPEIEEVGQRFRTPTRNAQEIEDLFSTVATIDVSEAYAKFLTALHDFSKVEEQALPYSFRGELYTYQKHGYDWLCFLRRYGLNGILADEMGLGKTVQAFVALLEAHSYSQAGTSLIVCPPIVVGAWEDEIRRVSSQSDFRVARYLGQGRRQLLDNLNLYDALLTTYTTVLNDKEFLSRIIWNYVVLDEAQKIKNHETATASACKELVAKHKLAITGTPIENRLSELWSLFDFLMPTFLGRYARFREEIEIPVMKQGDQKATSRLKTRIDPFKLRRTKKQVALQLPEKIHLDRYCELTPEQVQLYRQFATQEIERIENIPGNVVRVDTHVFTAILRLKQICCHPALIKKDFDLIHGRSGKFQAFLDIIDEIEENEEKALIFSQFTEMLSIIRRAFDETNRPYLYLDGSTPERERKRLRDEFQKGKIPFFLLSLKAGGVGITLTAANCVVHYDRWWNPAVEDQATDRVHRIGQENTVKVFRIHTVKTIEERIGQLLVKKKDLFDSVIEEDDLRKEISKEDLLALFTPP